MVKARAMGAVFGVMILHEDFWISGRPFVTILGALVVAAGFAGVELGPGLLREVRGTSGNGFWS